MPIDARQERRYRRVLVEPTLLAAILGSGTGASVPEEPVADLAVVGACWNHGRGLLELVVASASFDEVPMYEVTDLSPTTPLFHFYINFLIIDVKSRN